jgi:ElaB/YqjD/DUF883 family membrane-anchored ribosome-binding protein
MKWILCVIALFAMAAAPTFAQEAGGVSEDPPAEPRVETLREALDRILKESDLGDEPAGDKAEELRRLMERWRNQRDGKDPEENGGALAPSYRIIPGDDFPRLRILERPRWRIQEIDPQGLERLPEDMREMMERMREEMRESLKRMEEARRRFRQESEAMLERMRQRTEEMRKRVNDRAERHHEDGWDIEEYEEASPDGTWRVRVRIQRRLEAAPEPEPAAPESE